MLFSKLPLILTSALFSFAAAGDSTVEARSDRSVEAPPRAGDDRGNHRDGMCEVIACTDAQRTELAAIRKSTREQLRALDDRRGDARDAFAAAMREDELTAAEAAALFAEREAQMHARGEILAASFAKVHGALDAEQRELLAGHIQRHGIKAVIGGHGKADKGKAGKGKGKGKGKPGKGRRGAGDQSSAKR